MKKSVLRIALSAVLILFTFILITMSSFATGDPGSVEITACNLSFSDAVYIKYAVAFEGVNAEDVRLLVWTQEQSEYEVEQDPVILEPDGTQTVAGKECLIFDFKELGAKQMTDSVYARAYVKSASVDIYSSVNKYSILQYVYNKLGKTAQASDNESFKELLSEMLAYGSKAQNYFAYRTDHLATMDFYQVTLEGGYFSDLCSHGLYLAGETVQISAPETDENGKSFSHWTDGTAAVNSSASFAFIVPAKNVTLTAVYEESEKPASVGLKFESNGDGTACLVGMGTCTDVDVVIPSKTPDGDTVTEIDNSAFNGEEIVSITIPSSVTSIGRKAFQGCGSLTDVYYGGTEEQWGQVSVNGTGNTALTNATFHYTQPQEPEEPEITNPTVIVGSVTAEPGASDVAVTVAIRNNPGVASLVFDVQYDDALTLSSVDFNEQLTGSITSEPFGNPVMLMWIGGTFDIKTPDLTFATLHFSVPVAASGSYPISVTYDEDNVYNVADENVTFAVVNGGITVGN